MKLLFCAAAATRLRDKGQLQTFAAMGLRRATFTILLLGVCWAMAASVSRAQSRAQKKRPKAQAAAWNFVVSGDSRNCGNVVMPAIAAAARHNQAEFYWHLGDLRMIQRPDEDYLHEPEHRAESKNDLVLLANYEKNAWKDFIHEQVVPFRNMPFYLGIGNHELITPKTRQEFIQTFRSWLDQPALRQQRLADDPNDAAPKTYFHWKQAGIDFMYLDNSSLDQFSPLQMQWFEGILQRDESDPDIKTIVAAMHESLPDSLADQHSMSDSEVGKRTGRQVYADLVKAKAKGKKVYVLASHSHYYMDGVFNSEYLRRGGEILPGWIIGTGGAYRYKLPEHASEAKDAREAIYGYLVATVSASGEITFSFRQLEESDVPKATMNRYTPEFVHWCFVKNHE